MSTALPIDTNPIKTTMSSAVVLSFLFHGFLVIIGTLGLPYIRRPVLPPEPISVEIVEIDEITQTNKRAAAPKDEPKPIEKKIEPKEDKPVAPPKVDLQAPPKVTEPDPKPKPEPEKVKPKSKPVPPPPKEEELKKPEPKPEEKEEIVEEQQQEQFLSLLKNLQDGAPEETPQEVEEIAPENQISPLAQFSNRVTQSEMDAMKAALNRQFGNCWNLSAGAKYAEDINVKVRLFINPDRTVRDVHIVDQIRYNTDSFFKAAADNAMRAIRHPACQVLDLPPDKHEFWKDSIFNFNPSQML